jgi:hypothetical protein
VIRQKKIPVPANEGMSDAEITEELTAEAEEKYDTPWYDR